MTDTCSHPLDERDLLDWWADTLDARRRRPIEAHLLECDACSERLALLAGVAVGVRDLVRSGRALVTVTGDVLEKLGREGFAIREYSVPAGGEVLCTVAPDDEVLVARLRADLIGVPRVDLLSRIDDGPESRVVDVSFDPAAGELVLLVPIDVIRARPVHVERMRLVAVEPGGERLLGEYTFDHTPWPGHPGR